MTHTHYYQVKAKTHFELGRKLAQLFKEPSLETHNIILGKISNKKERLAESQVYLRLTQEYFPTYVEELMGYADGLHVDFATFWLTFLFEELNTYPEKCTSCFSSDGMIIGHNEDFYSHFKSRIAFLEKSIGDMNIFEIYYYNSLGGTSSGINSNGYVQTINTLNHIGQRIGIPRNIIARWLSETSNPQSDYKQFTQMVRSMGYCHTFANMKGEVFSIESTAHDSKLIDVKLPYVHTNHYLTDLSVYQDNSGPGNSLERYNEAIKLVRGCKTAHDMMNLLETISSLESNKKRECNTIARTVFDLNNKTVWCWSERERSKGWIEYPIHFL